MNLPFSPDPVPTICSHCGAKMVEYRHTFSQALAQGLYAVYMRNEPVNLKHLGLTRNQWDNFQKLRYWDLVERTTDGEGNRVGGVWNITGMGEGFVRGLYLIHRSVWTYRGSRVRYEGPPVSFQEIHGPYLRREQYAADARPHEQRGHP